MKVNLEQVLNDADGQPRQNIDVKKDEQQLPTKDVRGNLVLENKGPLKLKDVLFLSVNAVYNEPDGRPERVGYAEALIRGKLARRIKRGGELSLGAEEVKLILDLATKRYSADPELIVTLTELIDPDNKELKDKEDAKQETSA
ncbi:hypothetical protein HY346_00855 [Candidatus Microgenomates bacterium]|nr:hypothetical protein [Candidatus Microgenomates bacterium]